jgi:hypothetical protein
MVPVNLHAANTIAARAIWPSGDVVPRLRGRDLPLHICQQQLRLGQGQPQIGDVAKAIRPPDLHEVSAWTFAVGAGFHQPQNPRHAFTPFREPARKISNSPQHPQFRGGPDIETEISNQCPRLIANAINYYDSAILSRLLTRHAESPRRKALAMIKKVSSAAWRHIHLNGHYTFWGGGQVIDLDAIEERLDLA